MLYSLLAAAIAIGRPLGSRLGLGSLLEPLRGLLQVGRPSRPEGLSERRHLLLRRRALRRGLGLPKNAQASEKTRMKQTGTEKKETEGGTEGRREGGREGGHTRAREVGSEGVRSSET